MAALSERDESRVLEAASGEVEIATRRTRCAKVFHLGGRRYRVGASVAPIHYRRDPFDRQEPLKEIDLDLVPPEDGSCDLACEANGYQVRLWHQRDRHCCLAQYRRAGRWMEMAPVALLWMNDAGEQQVISKPAATKPVVDNERNRIVWPDAFGKGLHFGYILRPDHLLKLVTIQSSQALPRPSIGKEGLRLVVAMSLAWDREAKTSTGFAAERATALDVEPPKLTAPDEQVEMKAEFAHLDQRDRAIWWHQRPLAWDSAEEPQTFGMGWELRRTGESVVALASLEAKAVQSAVYPLHLDDSISEEQVAAALDDCYADSSHSHPGLSYIREDNYVRIGSSTLFYYTGGVRFQTVPLPQGVVIDTATLHVLNYTSGAGALGVYVACWDRDDAPSWNGSLTNLRAGYNDRTDAQAEWRDATVWVRDVWYTSSNVGAPVQEVVGRPGWSESNNLAFVVYPISTTLPSVAELRLTRAYNYSPAAAWKFNCTYSLGGSAFDALLLAGD